MTVRQPSHLFALGVCLAITVYGWAAGRHLHAPGIQYDETLQAAPAVHLANGQTNGNFMVTWKQTIGWRKIPLMCMEYMGALKTWGLVIAFKLFGVSVGVMRGFGLFVVMIGLIGLALVARRLANDWVAVVSVWLLATDASFVLCTRTDWGPVALAFTLRVWALWALVRWWQSDGQAPWLWLTSALLGLGLYDKVNFLWFILALAPVVMVAWWFQQPRIRLTKRDGVKAILIFFCASLPLWIYNVATGFLTFRLVKLPGQQLSLAQQWNAVFDRMPAVHALFTGRSLDYVWYGQSLGELPLSNVSWLASLTMLATVGLIVLALVKRRWDWLLAPAVLGLMMVQIFATPRPVWLHHWIGIYPLPHFIIPLFFVAAGATLRKPALVEWIGSLVVAGAVLVNLTLMAGYHQLMQTNGGVGVWSSSIYTLADTLQRDYAKRPIQVMDWGISNQLVLLSAGKQIVRDPFWNNEQDAQPRPVLLALLRDQHNVFVLHAKAQMAFPTCREALFNAAQALGVTLHTAHIIRERDGQALFEILEVADR